MLGFDFKLIIIPVVFPSSLITKFLKTGLDNISSNPALILIFSSFNVLNSFSFFQGSPPGFSPGFHGIVPPKLSPDDSPGVSPERFQEPPWEKVF